MKRAKIYLDFKRVLFFITLYIGKLHQIYPQNMSKTQIIMELQYYTKKGLQITSFK